MLYLLDVFLHHFVMYMYIVFHVFFYPHHPHARPTQLYKRLLALVCRAVDNQPAVDAALASVGLLAAEPGLAASTARLLTAELLFGTGQLVSEARPVLTVQRYADRLRAAAAAAAPAPAADRRPPREYRSAPAAPRRPLR